MEGSRYETEKNPENKKLKNLIQKHQARITSLYIFKVIFIKNLEERRVNIRDMFNIKLPNLNFDSNCLRLLFSIGENKKKSEKRSRAKNLLNCNNEFYDLTEDLVKKLYKRFLEGYPLSLALANLVVNYFITSIKFQSNNMFYLDNNIIDKCFGLNKTLDINCADKITYLLEKKNHWNMVNTEDEIKNNINRKIWYSVPKEYLTLPEVQIKFYNLIIKLRNDFSERLLSDLKQKYKQAKYKDESESDYDYRVISYINYINYNKSSKFISKSDYISKIFQLKDTDIFDWTGILSVLRISEVVDHLTCCIQESEIKYNPEGDGIFSLFGNFFIYGELDNLQTKNNLSCNCICYSLFFITIMESTGYPTNLIYLNIQNVHWGASCKDISSKIIVNYNEVKSRGQIHRLNLFSEKDRGNVFYNYTAGIARGLGSETNLGNINMDARILIERLIVTLSQMCKKNITAYDKHKFYPNKLKLTRKKFSKNLI